MSTCSSDQNLKRARPSWAGLGLFAAGFLALYAAAAVIAEFRVARAGAEAPFQRLLAARGAAADWVVLGASHALPLDWGEVPRRLEEDTGQRMLILAETGAGPLYMRMVADQALRDVAPARALYVLDDFAFFDRRWNAGRIEDRALLRLTPLRASTVALLAGAVRAEGVDPRALLDYLTGFSKLNPPERFPAQGWEGEAAFDRVHRPSRHAVRARMEFLYPDGAELAQARPALEDFARLLDRLGSAGTRVVVLRLPVPEAFRAAAPRPPAFEAALSRTLDAAGVPLVDLSAVLDAPEFYFDTDHLNRAGVEALYDRHLRELLSDPPETEGG